MLWRNFETSPHSIRITFKKLIVGGVEMRTIIDNRGEEHEWLLIVLTICSFFTLKKVKRLEQYKKKVISTFKPY